MRPRAVSNPPNPWASAEVEYLEPRPATVEVYEDHSRQILARNDSPDVPFTFSVNPYRGCMHACAYCYARPYHHYLGFGAGSDFDTRIVVKQKAAALLRAAFERPSWKGEVVAFSGATDCYQPLEASLRLTRACLEVCAEYRNPVGIVTKAPLVERDVDVLQQLGRDAAVRVQLSIPIWNPQHARALEPGVATPRRRVQAIERLSKAGVAVGVLVAPVIPGLGDEGVGELLEAARAAGATTASYALVRLPETVREVFEERLRQELPDRADKVLHRVRQTHGGGLHDPRFGARKRGEGPYAEAFAALFTSAARRLGYAGEPPAPPATFRRPPRPGAQLALF